MPNEQALNVHVPEERAELFRAAHAGATEEEYLVLLAALVRVLKPNLVLETGASEGHSAVAVGSALRENGFGKLISIEKSRRLIRTARHRVKAERVNAFVEFHHGESLSVLNSWSTPFSLAFFDSLLPLRSKECSLCLDRGLLSSGAVVTFHDSSKTRLTPAGVPDPETQLLWAGFESLQPRFSEVFEFKLSRGLFMARVK